MKTTIDRLFFGEVLAARPFLLRKAFLFLLGFDCLVDLVPHGGRYGVGGFNVAHFAILDRLLPMPTAATYVGSVLACGLVSLGLALGRTTRTGVLALAALYTCTWAMSMLDGYQHHYLVSLLLLSLAFFPDAAANAVFGTGPTPARTSAIGFVSFGLTCAIVYAYTALTKLEPDWRSGAALARLMEPEVAPRLFWELEGLGLDDAGVFELLAHVAIGVQLASALAYLLATTQDRCPTPGRRLFVALLGFFPAAFHCGVEQLDLEIGWFGSYMLVAACCFFLPRELLLPLGSLATAPVRRLAPSFAGIFRHGERFGATLLVAGVVPVVVGLTGSLDLPGDLGGGVAAAVVVLSPTLPAIAGGHLEHARTTAIAALVAAAIAFVAITHGAVGIGGDRRCIELRASTVRYDFYRFVGGDRRRRGETAEAIAAYRKAYRYAPDGTSQDETARKLARLGVDVPR